VSHERVLLDNSALIESVLALICRRKHLTAADAADFRQEAYLKLLQEGTLEKHEGRCSLRTFLQVVLIRLYKDFQIKRWGKWRPSVDARRKGPVAILLEQLIVRDGLTFEEAVETLRTNHRVALSRQELEAMAAPLPVRSVRKPQGEEVLVQVPSAARRPDEELAREELQTRAARVREALAEALAELEADDRLIIKLRYIDGLKIVQIARLLQVEAKPLYRRIEQVLAGLRRALEARGVDTAGLFDSEEPWE
jgi:RNA polymerase sigma factor (sigma-70 family)